MTTRAPAVLKNSFFYFFPKDVGYNDTDNDNLVSLDGDGDGDEDGG